MVTDVLVVVILGAGVGMLSYMENIAMNTPAITLELMVGVAYAVDVLTNLLLYALIIEAVTAVDVDILADENVSDLAAVMTPLEFTLPAP